MNKKYLGFESHGVKRYGNIRITHLTDKYVIDKVPAPEYYSSILTDEGNAAVIFHGWEDFVEAEKFIVEAHEKGQTALQIEKAMKDMIKEKMVA